MSPQISVALLRNVGDNEPEVRYREAFFPFCPATVGIDREPMLKLIPLSAEQMTCYCASQAGTRGFSAAHRCH
jgi:hypothetical protein